MSLDSGHSVKVLSVQEKAKLDKDFPTVAGIDLIRLQPDGWFLYDTYLNNANEIFNFKFRATDVLLMTIPKSGTTWTQNLVWNMRHNPNLEVSLDQMDLFRFSPQIDLDFFFHAPSVSKFLEQFKSEIMKTDPEVDTEGPIYLQLANQMEGPRTLKTHLPLSLYRKDLLDTCKVVYVARNPKDVCVSYHHHCKLLKFHDYIGSFDDFVDYFLSDSVFFLPYWPHVKEAHARRGHKNLHILYYEDLKKDTMAEVKKLDNFLQTNLTEKQMQNIIKNTNFANMKEKQDEIFQGEKSISAFNEKVFKEEGGTVRKGIVGDSKSRFTSDQNKKFSKWIEENTKDFDAWFLYSRSDMY